MLALRILSDQKNVKNTTIITLNKVKRLKKHCFQSNPILLPTLLLTSTKMTRVLRPRTRILRPWQSTIVRGRDSTPSFRPRTSDDSSQDERRIVIRPNCQGRDRVDTIVPGSRPRTRILSSQDEIVSKSSSQDDSSQDEFVTVLSRPRTIVLSSQDELVSTLTDVSSLPRTR